MESHAEPPKSEEICERASAFLLCTMHPHARHSEDQSSTHPAQHVQQRRSPVAGGGRITLNQPLQGGQNLGCPVV